MKQIFVKLIILFLTLTTLNEGAFAQTQSGPATVADKASPTPAPDLEGSRPGSIHLNIGKIGFPKFKRWPSPNRGIFSRLNELNIENLIASQNSTGVREKSYLAAFAVSGAMVYDYDFSQGQKQTGNDRHLLKDYAKYGPNMGQELLPFTLTVAEGGIYYLTFSAYSLRNKNAYNNIFPKDSTSSNFFKIVDNIDFLVMKFDREFSFRNLSETSFYWAHVDAKVDILGSSVPSRYLAIKFGGQIGQEWETLYSPAGPTYLGADVNSDGSIREKGALATQGTYGLEYNNVTHKGVKLNIQALINNRWIHGDASDLANSAAYQAEVAAYNQQVKKGFTPVAPVDNRTVTFVHHSYYFDPTLEISKHFVRPNSVRPPEVGVDVSGNIPLLDQIRTNGTLGHFDESQYNNQLVKVKLFVRF